MDLLLTHGYFLDEDPKERAIMKPYAPLGLLYISSHLRSQGFDVEVYDSTFGSMEELRRLLRSQAPAVLGIYANLMTRRNAIEITGMAREAGWTVVLGGPEPSNYPAEYLAAGAHAVVEGEGEVTMQELLAALRCSSGALGRVNGIYFKDGNGAMVRTAPRALIPDLDRQPWPDRERVDIARYLDVWRRHHGRGSVSIITARGCPYHCRWCSHSTFGKTHRRRSPEKVADELEWLLGRYAPDMLWIADDVFTIHPGWILRYAAELRRRGLRLPFECITRADRLDARMADALAELGCFRVWIGSESGSQRILDGMERGVTVAQVQEAVHLCRARGIETGMFLMWGYEGEELRDIEATVEHVKAARPDVFLTTVAYPIKGTPYYQSVMPKVVNGAPWRETSDRELRIRGRHSRRYYGFADQLLRSEVNLDRLLEERAAESELAQLRSSIAAARAGLAEAEQEVEA